MHPSTPPVKPLTPSHFRTIARISRIRETPAVPGIRGPDMEGIPGMVFFAPEERENSGRCKEPEGRRGAGFESPNE
jgi:hypothetical protein